MEEEYIKNGAYLNIIGVPPEPYFDSSANFSIFIVNDYAGPYPPDPRFKVIITNTQYENNYPRGTNVWLSNFTTGYGSYQSGNFHKTYRVYVRNWDSVQPFIKSVVRGFLVCPRCRNKVQPDYIWPRSDYQCGNCRAIFTRFDLKE